MHEHELAVWISVVRVRPRTFRSITDLLLALVSMHLEECIIPISKTPPPPLWSTPKQASGAIVYKRKRHLFIGRDLVRYRN